MSPRFPRRVWRSLAVGAVVVAVASTTAAFAFAEPGAQDGEPVSGPIGFESLGVDLWPGDARAAAELPIGTEPTKPFPQPDDPPMRGCTTVADPAAPPSDSPPAIQVLYAYHADNPDRFDEAAEPIAEVIDRVDWSLDASSDYDQHLKLNCSRTDDGSYGDYARALVQPLQISSGTAEYVSSADVRKDLEAAGYVDANRWYVVFTDFDSESDSYLCPSTGGKSCSAVTELWDSGVTGHEMGHLLGAGHAWMTQKGEPYVPDIMYGWDDWWVFDTGYNGYYDPSETAATFHLDPAPSTAKVNIAATPVLTEPKPDDSRLNDLLTAQERTVEAGAPGTAPAGFTKIGDTYIQVASACGTSGASCTYFDGRRSLAVATTTAESGFTVTRTPEVTAGSRYKFFARLRDDATGQVRLRMTWLDADGAVVADSDTDPIDPVTDWYEYRLTATAPEGAAAVRVGVAAAEGQTGFTFVVDSLQLNACTADGCRYDT